MGRETKVFPALAMDVMKTGSESIILYCMNDHCVACNRYFQNLINLILFRNVPKAIDSESQFVSEVGMALFQECTLFLLQCMMILLADCHALFRQ